MEGRQLETKQHGRREDNLKQNNMEGRQLETKQHGGKTT